MAKKSIRSLSLQKMASPALHTIIVATKAKSSSIQEYINVKRERGSQAVPKPILSGPVVQELSMKLTNCTEKRTGVGCILVCMEEFGTNYDPQPWQENSSAISDLLVQCLSCYIAAQKKGLFMEYSKTFNRLCHLIADIAVYSKELSSQLFSKGSHAMFTLYFSAEMNEQWRSGILYTLSTLGHHSKPSLVSETLQKFHIHLKLIVQDMMKYPIETQMSIYFLLHKSLLSIEHAQKSAAIWFCRWPVLINTFVQCFSKSSINEGCGIFLGKLDDVKHNRDALNDAKHMPTRTPSSVTNSMKSNPSVNTPKLSKVNLASNKDDSPVFKKPAKPLKTHGSVKFSVNTTVSTAEASNARGSLASMSQTPHRPNHRLNLPLVQPERTHSDSSQTVRCSKVEERDEKTINKAGWKKRGQSVKREVEVRAQSPLSDLECDDQSRKVERWLSSSTSSGKVQDPSDDDVQIIDSVPISCKAKISVGQKRKSSELLSNMKRPRQCSPFMSLSPNSATQSSMMTGKKADGASIFRSSECEEKPVALKLGKRKLFSKSTEMSNCPYFPEKEEPHFQFHVNDQKLDQKPRTSVWKHKVKELEEESNIVKEGKDEYNFRDLKICSAYPVKLKKSGATAKTPALCKNTRKKKSSPRACMKAPASCKSNDKENKKPKTAIRKSAFEPQAAVEISSSFTQLEKCLNVVTSTPCFEKVEVMAYSPPVDDSMEKIIPDQSAVGVVKESFTVREPFPVGSKKWKVSTIKQEEVIKTMPSCSSNVHLGTSKVEGTCVPTGGNRNPVNIFSPKAACGGSSKVEGSCVYTGTNRNPVAYPHNLKTPSAGCCFKSPMSSIGPYVSGTRDLDSGVEVTSNDEGETSRTGKPSNAHLRFLLHKYANEALSHNSKMAANNTVVTSEIKEIKDLAEKISLSVSRCQIAATGNGQLLSDQAASLQANSKQIDDDEVHYVEIRRNVRAGIRARNAERVTKIIKDLLASNNLTESDSD